MSVKFCLAWVTPLVFGIAACSTPQERCVMTASEELRRVEQLITETEIDLERGYRIEQNIRPGFELQFCHDVNGNFRWCNRHVTRVSENEVAVDPMAERRKLDALNARRNSLITKYNTDLASCEARFPPDE